MAELTVQLRTLTPIWTGGVDGTMDRIHETGILGSLRWWYEAIVRGLGGSACDPTKHEHELSGQRLKRYEQARREGKDWWTALDEAGICDACKVFGTTGWRRRFQLEVRPLEGEIDLTEGMFPSGRVHLDKHKPYRVGGWMLRGGYFGTLELRLTGDERILLCEILPTVLFIEQWGTLGPKTSVGYGVIEITEIRFGGQTYKREQGEWCTQLNELVSLKCQESIVGKWWWSQELSTFSPYQGGLPALTNMFFGKARFTVTDSNWWRTFREIQWLQAEQIGANQAHWTGGNKKPTGPFKIPNPLPVSRIEHWVHCHDTFPLAPIVRTLLRYGYVSIKPLVGYKQDFFGFVHGQKRQQSRIHISWAYQIQEGKWEFRIWGWWYENNKNKNPVNHLRDILGITKKCQWSAATTGKDTLWSSNRLNLKDVQICWFSKYDDENAENFILSLNNCKEVHADSGG